MHTKTLSRIVKDTASYTKDVTNNKEQLLVSFLEYKVLEFVLQGMTNREIADILNFTVRNIEKYVSRLLSKTGTKNRTHLTQYCYGRQINVKRANDGNRTRE